MRYELTDNEWTAIKPRGCPLCWLMGMIETLGWRKREWRPPLT